MEASDDRCDVLAVLRHLSQADQQLADDATVRRYLRAYVNDPKAAAKALAATLKWRRQTQPQRQLCGACARDPRSHNLRLVGIDRMERPVLYTCFSQALNRLNATDNVDHLIRSMEDSNAVMHSRASTGKGNPGCWVFIVDYHGYSWLVDTNPRTALLAAQLLAHYPERLGRCIMVDAPSAFAGTWAVLKGVLNEVTTGKIVFVRSHDGSLAKELSKWADASLQCWLLTEIAENRLERNQGGKKMYWKPPSQGSKGQVTHDPRASAEFLASPQFQLTLTRRLGDPERCEPAPEGDGRAIGGYRGAFALLMWHAALLQLWAWGVHIGALIVGELLFCTAVSFLAPVFKESSATKHKASSPAHREAQVMDRPKPADDRGKLGVSCWSCFPFCECGYGSRDLDHFQTG